jgi:DNA-binding MarR family transcriptional regulator
MLLLSVVGAHAARLVEESLALTEIDSREFAILALLTDVGAPVAQETIAARLRRDRTTVMKLARRMEWAGLVSRDRDLGDRRVMTVMVTSKGSDTFRLAEDNLESLELEVLGILSTAERELFLRTLQRLA